MGTAEDTKTYEHFVDVEEDIETSGKYVDSEEHTAGHVIDVDTMEAEDTRLIEFLLDVDGVTHRALIPEDGLVDGLPPAATSYPNVDRISDLAERRVPITGTGGKTVSLDEFRCTYVKNASLSKEEQWTCFQHGLLDRTDNGWFTTTGSLEEYEQTSRNLFLATAAGAPAVIMALSLGLILLGIEAAALLIIVASVTMLAGVIPSHIYRRNRDRWTDLPV